jgi:hypothetical protein
LHARVSTLNLRGSASGLLSYGQPFFSSAIATNAPRSGFASLTVNVCTCAHIKKKLAHKARARSAIRTYFERRGLRHRVAEYAAGIDQLHGVIVFDKLEQAEQRQELWC